MDIVVGKNRKKLKSAVKLTVGDVLNDELKARGIKRVDFAKRLGITPGNLTELMSGARNVSAFTAIKMEKILGISAKFWLKIQLDKDLRVARLKFKK